MQNNFDEIISNIRYVTADKCFITIPRWATFLAELGNAICSYQHESKRLVIGVSLPTRSHAAVLCATGIIVSKIINSKKLSDNNEYFEKVCQLEYGTSLFYIENGRRYKAFFEEVTIYDNQKRVKIKVEKGTSYLISKEMVSKIILSEKHISRIPKAQKGYNVSPNQLFLSNIFGEERASRFVLNSNLESIIFGPFGILKKETFETTIAYPLEENQNKFIKANFNDLLRVKKLLLSPAACYRTEIFSANRRELQEINDFKSTTIIFDGANGLLKWFDRFSNSNIIIILDRTDARYDEGIAFMNKEYLSKRIYESDFSLNPKELQPGIEIMYYEENKY